MTRPKDEERTIRIELPSQLELLGIIDKIADGITEFMEFEDVDRDAVAISVIEACTNAIQHGHGEQPDRSVVLEFTLREDSLEIEVRDRGPGFQPVLEEEPLPPDLLATRGRGIFIMRSMMDEVEFNSSNGTCVRLVKRRRPIASDPPPS